ncbi:glycosyltransferase [Rhizobium deserti]|uniref:Glycosyltransferase n=2 Tax=Rhizobium deserti TaxID=2547961 RepID=A0A4R5UPQ4_9HYPH|nr:glycosyltransferase [Rhizobium deserti]
MWKATGEDPAFKLSYNVMRDAFVLIHLTPENGKTLDPRVYIDRGKGFREQDSMILSTAGSFLITADVGRLGLIRSFRLDPCSKPSTFRMEAKTFPSKAALTAYVKLLDGVESTQQAELGVLPRFRLKVPRFSSSKSPLLTRFVQASYALAARETPSPYDQIEPWLSIIVPVYNASARHLDDLLSSFDNQDQHGAELIFSDDGSNSDDTRQWFLSRKERNNLKIIMNSENAGIASATNAGLLEAKGEWITFLDHDDMIAPHALKLIRKALSENRKTTFLYTDELIVDDSLKPIGTLLKPAYDAVLLTGLNYINHFSIYRHDRLRQIGYLRSGFDGSQDYDTLLRYLHGQNEEEILHLPFPAYWWRRTSNTYSQTFLKQATINARNALEDHFARYGDRVQVTSAITATLHRPVFDTNELTWPKISIIIPSRNSFALISRILTDVYERTDYPDYEVIVVDNGTTDQNVLDLYKMWERNEASFSVLMKSEPFNFSRSINRGMQASKGGAFLILNNDVEVIEDQWLKEMASCLSLKDAGIVGAKLLFPDDTIQHAGIIVGFGGLAGHWYLRSPKDYGGAMNRLHVRNSFTCVTGAVMLISAECARAVGMWDEDHFAIAYNDVDYCLRASKAGYRIVWTPFACLYHHESLSRGPETGEDKIRRFEMEKSHLRKLHSTEDFQDFALNPNLSRDMSVPRMIVPQILYPPRGGGVPSR